MKLDSALVAAWYDAYAPALHRYLVAAAGGTDAADDLVQEVFVRVVRRGTGAANPRAWLFAIARNLVRDRARREARAPVHGSLSGIQPGSGPVPAPDRGFDLDRALAALPDEQREAFLMRECGGLGYAEIAAVQQTTPDAVRNRIYRARCRLRRALAPEAPAVRPREASR